MSLLAGSVQPPLLTLLSSTSSPSLSPLFKSVTGASEDSHITAVRDNSPSPELIPRHDTRGNIAQTIVHIQSSNPKSTYIQAGCSKSHYQQFVRGSHNNGKSRAMADHTLPLGIELPWVGMQVKRLGKRDLSFEVGITDSRGREGVIRCSTFKSNPTLHGNRIPPLIHLPLNLPPPSNTQLTPWLHVPLDLAPLIQLFQILPSPLCDTNDEGDDESINDSPSRKRRKVVELPNGSFGSVTYVKVYANCRLRRIWFSAEGEKTIESMGKGVKDEWQLYAAEQASKTL